MQTILCNARQRRDYETTAAVGSHDRYVCGSDFVLLWRINSKVLILIIAKFCDVTEPPPTNKLLGVQ
jgi:hypothetical protein